MRLTSITTASIQTLVSERVDDGAAPRTVNSMLKIMSAIMKWAVDLNYVTKNPVENVHRVRVVEEEMEFLDADEVKRLLAACAARDEKQVEEFDKLLEKRQLPNYRRKVEELKRPGRPFTLTYPLVATAVLSGLRQGELLGLKWSDYDPVRGILFVRRTYSPAYGFSEPKSKKSRRAVQISPELVSVLDSYRATTDYAEADNLVFPNCDGKPNDYHNVSKRGFDKALDEAKLRHIRFHDLRHTYAALMIGLGVNIKWLQNQLGHSSISITLDTYGHVLPTVEEHVGGKLDSLVFDPKIVSLPVTRGQ